LGTKKNRKTTFYVASKKSLVTKVVGLRKMHMSAKNGVKIQKFAMKLAKNHGHMGRKPGELLLGGIFCEEFFYETLVCLVLYFS
jgi:hypothetical protein